jgi:hypothetical protein
MKEYEEQCRKGGQWKRRVNELITCGGGRWRKAMKAGEEGG